MPAKYSDAEIQEMLDERKTVTSSHSIITRLKQKRAHRQREIDITGAEGHNFRLILRQNEINPLDFSIIIALIPSESNQLFRLKRYNGKSHEHTNRIEKDTFYDFHIHIATERYQDLGVREDSYAEPSDRFSDFHTALQCMFSNCVFEIPDDDRPMLFGETMP